jgi:hypothetical protein
MLVMQQAFEILPFPMLEYPSVHDHEPAITQRQDCAAEEYALGPFEDQR